MKRFKKTISFLILTVYLSAMLFQNLAYGSPVGEVNQDPAILEYLGLEISDKEVTSGGIVTFSATLVGFSEEVHHVEAYFEHAEDPSVAKYLWMESPDNGYFRSTVHVGSNDKAGLYEMKKLIVYTANGHYEIYSGDNEGAALKYDFSPVSFSITGTYGGINPEISISLEDRVYLAGESVSVSAHVDESEITFNEVVINFRHENRNESIRLAKTDAATFSGTHELSAYLHSGDYSITHVNLYGDTSIVVYNSAYMEHVLNQDFSSHKLVVEGGEPDLKAPTLTAVEIGGSVLAPEGSLNFKVYAEDDVSGVKSGHLYYKDGEDNRIHIDLHHNGEYLEGVLKGQYSMNNGSYVLHSVTLYDHYGHMSNWYDINSGHVPQEELFAFGHMNFSVEGALGEYKPEIRIEKNKGIATVNDTVTIDVFVVNPPFEFDEASINFSVAENFSHGYEMINLGNGHFRVNIDVHSFLRNGDYQIYNVNLVKGSEYFGVYNEALIPDSYDNHRTDLSAGDFTVFDTFQGFIPEMSLVSQQSVYSLNEEIIIEANLIDTTKRFDNLSVSFIRTDVLGHETLSLNLNYDDSTQTYKGSTRVNHFTPSGVYDVYWVTYNVNNAGTSVINSKYQTGHETASNFPNSVFSIEGTYGDMDTKFDISINQNEFSAGDLLELILSSPIPDLTIENHHIIFENENGKRMEVYSGYYSGQPSLQKEIHQYTAPGTYKMSHIGVNINGTWVSIYNVGAEGNATSITQDFSHLDFTVTGTLEDFVNPVFESIEIINRIGTTGEQITMKLNATDNLSGVSNAYATYVDNGGQQIGIEFTLIEGELIGKFMPYYQNYSGEYRLQWLRIGDYAENSIEYWNRDMIEENGHPWQVGSDFSDYNISIHGTYGGFNPEVAISVTQNILTSGDMLQFELSLDENASEISKVIVHYTLDDHEYTEFSFEMDRSFSDVFTAQRMIGAFHKMGDFRISYIELHKGSNHIVSIHNGTDTEERYWMKYQDMSSGDFTVENTKFGLDPIISVEYSKDIVRPGQDVELVAHMEDLDIRPYEISATLETTDGEKTWNEYISFYFDESREQYIARPYIHNSWKSGKYVIKDIRLHMDNNWSNMVYSDFTAEMFEVQGSLGGYQPEIVAAVNASQATVGEEIVLTFEVDEDIVDFTYGSVRLGRDRNEVGYFNDYTWYRLEHTEKGLFKVTIPVKEYTKAGNFELDYIDLGSHSFSVRVYDVRSNYPSPNTQDFSNLDFEISGTKEDKKAPELVSISYLQEPVFIGDSLNLAFEITEEESGFNNGYVSLVNEHGHQVDGSLIIEDGVISAVIYFRSYMTPGVYTIDSLSMEDNAQNMVHYSNQEKDPHGNWGTPYDFSDYKVVAKYAPLEDFSVKLSSANVGSKETLYITGSITAPLSGYSYAELEYINPEGEYHAVYTNVRSDGKFFAELYIMGNEVAGDYILNRVVLSTGNRRYYMQHHETRSDEGFSDLSEGNYTVYGTIKDYESPVFRGVSLAKSNLGPQETLVLTVRAEDLGVGLGIGHAEFFHPETGRLIYMHLDKSGISTYRGSVIISTTEASGEWVLRELILYDEVWNGKQFYHEGYAPIFYGDPADLTAANFTVTGTVIDNEGPEYFSSRVKSQNIRSYELLEVYLEAEDYLSDISYFLIDYKKSDGEVITFGGMSMENRPHTIRGGVDFTEDQYLEAAEIRIYDTEDNETVISVADYDLSHLDVQVTAVEVNDISGYVQDVFADGEWFEYGQDIPLLYIPGRSITDVKTARLFYRYGEVGNIFSLESTEDRYGYHVALFDREHEHYHGSTDYEFLYMEIEKNDGEIITIHTPWYPESDNILPAYGAHFTIQRNMNARILALSSFEMENRTISMDEKISFDLIADTEEKITGYDIHFRVNGEVSEEAVQIRDMNRQEFYASRYSHTGEYTVDFVTVYVEEEGVRIYNSQYYPFFEHAYSFGEQSFTVAGTVGDKKAPVINTIEIASQLLEPGTQQHFTVNASDEGTGVDYGVLYLEDPMGKIGTETPVYLYMDETDGLLKGTFKITEVSLVGNYRISYLEIYDKALNVTRMNNISSHGNVIPDSVNIDLSEHDFAVEGALTDNTPPVFRGFTFEENSELVDGIRNIIIDAEDDESGLKNIRLVYTTGGVEKRIDSSISTMGDKHFASIVFDPAHKEVWRLRRVELTDQIGNQSIYYHGTDLTLANTLDLTFGNYTPMEPVKAPALESIELEQKTVKPGEELSIKAGLIVEGILPEKIQATFWSESYQTVRNYELIIQSDGSYAGKFIVSQYELDSIWTLQSITSKDRFERISTITAKDLTEEASGYWKSASYEVLDSTPDNEAPELEDINLSKVEQNLFARAMFSFRSMFVSVPEAASFTLGDTIRFTVNAEDEVSGVKRIILEYKVMNQIVIIEKDLAASGGTSYTGEFTVSSYHPSGEWRLEKVSLFDDADNARVIEKNKDTGLVPGYGKLNFTVRGTQPDKTSPVIGSVSVSKNSVELGERITYTAEITDDDSGVKEVRLRISASKMGGTKNIAMKDMGNGTFEGELLITPDMPGDIWRVESVVALDSMGNEGRISNQLMGISTLSTRRNLTDLDVAVKTEQRIQITTSPKTEYQMGDRLSTEGLEVKLTYSDGSTKKLDLENVRIGSLNTTTAGEKEVSLLYNALRTSLKVQVTEPEVREIRMGTLPLQSYFAGQELNLDGAKIDITYVNGFERSIKLENGHVSNYDRYLAGEQTLTVKYGDKTASFSVHVKAIELESITIVNPPAKLQYIEGQTLNLDGILVTGVNNDGSVADIDVTMENIFGFDSSEAKEEQIVTVEINGITSTFTVTIIPKVLESIRITSEPINLDYVEGDELDLTGLEVIGTYNDGDEAKLEIAVADTLGFDSSKAVDSQLVTITAEEKTATFTVRIIPKVLEQIEITKAPSKTVYVEGQDLDITGLEVTGTYNNGKTEIIDPASLTLSGYDKNSVQDMQEITVKISEQTASYTVSVIRRVMEKIEITKLPEVRTYVAGQTLKLEGLEVAATFNDGSSEILENSAYTLMGFNSSAAEESQVVTVESEGLKDTFTVDIVERAVISIEVTKKPAKLEYIEGQELDLTGLEVTGTFNDETSEKLVVTEENLFGFDSSKATTDQSVTVKFEGKTASFSVNIIPRVLESIEITSEPEKTSYFQGERINLEGLEVYGTYNDGDREKLMIAMSDISGFNSKDPVEKQLVTINVEGKTAAWTVEIIEIVLESIRIANLPKTLVYVAGQKLNIEGLEVYGSYNNGNESLLPITVDHITGFDSRTPLIDQLITVSVEGKTAEFSVKIIPKVLNELKITEEPVKKVYVEGQELDLEGLKVEAVYNDGETVATEIRPENVSGFDKTRIGEDQIITITVEEKTVSFSISVRENIVEEVRIAASPERVKYFIHEDLDITGLKVEAVYSDGKTVDVTGDISISGFNAEKAAIQQEITVTYEGKTDAFYVDIFTGDSITAELNDLDTTLDKEKLMALKELMDNLDESEESREIVKTYEAVLQNVLKVEKVVKDTEIIDTPGIMITTDNLRALNIPEVLEEDVKSVRVELRSEIMTKERIEQYAGKLDVNQSIIALYDMSLVKVIERVDQTENEEKISNDDINMITLRMPVPEQYSDHEELTVIYISEDGSLEELTTVSRTVEGIRYLYFETDHFSLYGIMATESEVPDETEVPAEPEEPSDNEDGADSEQPGIDEGDEDNEVIDEENPSDEKEQTGGDSKEEESAEDKAAEEVKEEINKPTTNPEKDVNADKDLPKLGEEKGIYFLMMGVFIILGGLIFLKKRDVKLT